MQFAAALSGHSKLACIAVLRSVLAEGTHRKRPTPELVWTGPEGTGAQARDTAVVLQALFESARKRVVLAPRRDIVLASRPNSFSIPGSSTEIAADK